MIIENVMSILFSNRRASIQVDPIIPTFARSILSCFSMVFIPYAPSCLCFSRPPTLFFKDSDFSIMYPFNDGKPLHPFPSMFLSGDSQEDTNGASSSSFSFLLRWIQFKLCRSYPFLVQMFSHAGAPLNHPPLAIHVYLEC